MRDQRRRRRNLDNKEDVSTSIFFFMKKNILTQNTTIFDSVSLLFAIYFFSFLWRTRMRLFYFWLFIGFLKNLWVPRFLQFLLDFFFFVTFIVNIIKLIHVKLIFFVVVVLLNQKYWKNNNIILNNNFWKKNNNLIFEWTNLTNNRFFFSFANTFLNIIIYLKKNPSLFFVCNLPCNASNLNLNKKNIWSFKFNFFCFININFFFSLFEILEWLNLFGKSKIYLNLNKFSVNV